MRILNGTLFQKAGGVESMFRYYGKAILENGHELLFLISQNGNENYNSCVAQRIFKLKNNSVIFDFCRILGILIKYRPDIAIVHQSRLMKWVSIIRKIQKYLPIKKSKMVAVIHGNAFKAALNCDFVITVNHEIRDKIANCGFSAKKIFVLHNAIEVSERYQYKFRQKHKPLTIGIYGRIEHDKGFDILLDAAKILKNKAIDFRIKLGGFDVDSGYNTQDLYQLACQNKIAENCDFVGFVVDKKEFFQNVDIFCIPSRHESFGLTILDGFLFSTPVISSNTIGAKILIKNGENGLIFDNHDPEDLAQKIIAIANNEIDGERLAKTAYLKLQKEFSLPIFAKNLQKILHKILGDTQN